MYVQSNTVVRSPNHRCYGKAKFPSICIVCYLHVTVNDIKAFSIAMVMQQCVTFILLITDMNLLTI